MLHISVRSAYFTLRKKLVRPFVLRQKHEFQYTIHIKQMLHCTGMTKTKFVRNVGVDPQ